MTKPSDAQPPQKSRRGRAARIVGVGFALLVVLYFALPLLIPGAWIVRTLSRRLGTIMNRTVSIERVAFDYGTGLKIQGLKIARRPGFGEGQLLEADEIAVALAGSKFAEPAALLGHLLGLSTGQFEQITIRNPQGWIVVNASGALNIADLNDQGGVRLPAKFFDISAMTITFEDLRQTPREQAVSDHRIVLPRLQCRLAPSTGRINLQSSPPDADTPEHLDSKVAVSGDVTTPRLSSEASLGGGGSLRWEDLDLAQIPLLLFPIPGLKSLEGTSDGSLELQVSADLRVEFTAQLELHDARVQLAGERQWAPLREAQLRVDGWWDPQSQVIDVSNLDYGKPGTLVIHGRPGATSAVLIDPRSDRPLSIALSGRADSIDVLRNQLRLLGLPDPPELHTAGAADFEFEYSQVTGIEQCKLHLDASSTRIALDNQIDLPAGERKILDISLRRLAGGAWRLTQAKLAIHESILGLRGSWPVRAFENSLVPGHANKRGLGLEVAAGAPAGRSPKSARRPTRGSAATKPSRRFEGVDSLAEYVRRGLSEHGGEFEIETADLAGLSERFPGLTSALPTLSGKGPATLQLVFEPAADGLQFAGQVSLGAPAVLQVGEHFTKTQGQELRISLSGSVTRDKPTKIENLGLQVSFGDFRLVTSPADTHLTVSTNLPESAWDRDKLLRGVLDSSFATSFEIQALEQGLELTPTWSRRLTRKFSSELPLAGDFSGSIVGLASLTNRRPVVRLHAEIDASKLKIDAADTFYSPAGSRCDLNIDYLFDGRSRREFEMIDLQANLTGGTLRLLTERTSPAEADDSFSKRTARYTATVGNLADFLPQFPALSKRLDSYQPGGSAELSLATEQADQAEHWMARADFTGINLPETADGWKKPAGMPLILSATGRFEGDERSETLNLDELACTLGSSSFFASEVLAKIGNLHPRSTSDGMERVLHEFSATGQVVLDQTGDWPLSLVRPDLGRWLERQAAGGLLTGDFDVGFDGSQWTLSVTAAAPEMHFATPRLAKPAGMSCDFECSLTFEPASDDEHLDRVTVRNCEIRAGRLSGSIDGQFAWRTEATVFDTPKQFDVAAVVEFADLSDLGKIIPALAQAELHGRATVVGAVSGANGNWRTEEALLSIEDVQLTTGDSELFAHGTVQYSDGRWHSDSLALELGQARALMSFDGCPSESDEPLSAQLRLNDFDWQALVADLEVAGGDLASLLSDVTGDPVDENLLAELLSPERLLGRLYLDATIEAETVRWTDEDTGLAQAVQELTGRLAWREGEFDFTLQGACAGGALQAQLVGPPDQYDVQFVLLDALPLPVCKSWIRHAFPGLEPTGTIDYSRIPGAPPKEWAATAETPIFYGELIVRGGLLRGKAAPGWITTVFPRLNLADFRFELMHDWYTAYADGRVQHHAVFKGAFYHLYASGWENTDHTVAYQIGIDLLGGLDSPFWATSGRGRIPLFDSITRLGDDGEVLEESVNYVPLEFVKAIVWGANPIHTGYLALRKRLEGK